MRNIPHTIYFAVDLTTAHEKEEKAVVPSLKIVFKFSLVIASGINRGR
jgi:hypothetical protein